MSHLTKLSTLQRDLMGFMAKKKKKKKRYFEHFQTFIFQLLWSMDFKQLGVVLHYVNCKDRVEGESLLEILVLSVNELWL